MRLKKKYKSLLNGKDFFLNQNVCPIILIDTHIFFGLIVCPIYLFVFFNFKIIS